MTLSPTISWWSSRVSLRAFVSCIFVSPHLELLVSFLSFLFCIFCIQFIANLSVNSLHILVRSYLSSELRWQVVSLWWTRSHWFVLFGPTEIFWCNRSTQLGVTNSITGKQTCHLSLISVCSSSTQWFLSSTSIILDMLLCSVTRGPTHLYHMSRRALLGNWCQRGRERSHQSLILPIGGERENTQGDKVSQLGESNIIKDPRCLVFKRRDVTCL